MKSVLITTDVVSSNPAQARCTRYNIIVIKFVSDWRQVGDVLLVLRFPPPIALTARCRGGSQRSPLEIEKNMIFWRKIVIFHTKHPKHFSRLPLLGAIFVSTPPPPNLKSCIRPCDITEIMLSTMNVNITCQS
jgi:hypothetical protein